MSSPPARPELLIAVTGAPGEGKTGLLAGLVAEHEAAGRPVEGLLALAGERTEPGQGARHYFLRILGHPDEWPWAERNDELTPPYVFESGTKRRLQLWAEDLAAGPAPDLIVLDEFGRFEARGDGLMPLWPKILAARPAIVAMSVRAGCEDDIEARLGRRFDVRIAAGDRAAGEKLRQACADYGEWTRLGLVGGAAGGMEMTVGSLMHSARIPARGLMMCSLQGAMMTFAGFGLTQPGRVVWVPFISAGLKALSPAGSRIRPMIAIVMQGLLYGISVQVLGWNAFAVTLGGALIGAWSALQGFFLQYLLMGEDLIRAYDSTVLWLADKWALAAPSLPVLVGAWAGFCALFAAAIAFTAWRLQAPPAALQKLIERDPARANARPAHPGGRLRELAHWQFWLPLLVVSAILLAAGRPWESILWLVLRFVVVAIVLLALVSLLRPARWAERLRRRGWWGPAVAFSGAVSSRTSKQ
ncbi:MAG TPA: hypothetical protein VEB66_08380 [Opitutaceae bacterium]|nr:hypothetical protein [Opitutaceae bacterium]